jgi:hypothetical protein
MTMTVIAGKATDPTRWLGLMAAPTLAVMALIAASDSPPLALCAARATILPIDDMTAMYLLMSLFHLPPWLKFAVRG